MKIRKSIYRVLGLLSFLAGILVLPASARAEQVPYAVKGGDLWFETATGEIVGAEESVREAVIPARIRKVKVTGIGEYAFSKHARLKKVTLPSTLQSIGEGSFYKCTALREIEIPRRVKQIGEYAFGGCTALELVKFHRKQSNIDLHELAFWGNDWVTTPDYSPAYKKSVYYRRLKKVQFTGNYREDVVAIARSQLGYCEGDAAEELDGAKEGDSDYSEYGRALGSNGRPWCSEFASWCIRQAGVSRMIIQSSTSASMEAFQAPAYLWEETTFAGGGYRPKKGDLVLFAWGKAKIGDPYLSHTAIILGSKKVDETIELQVIHGNYRGKVRETTFYINAADGKMLKEKKGSAAYIVAPSYGRKRGRNRVLQFDANGGETPEASRTVAYQADYGVLPVPVRSGYKFTGWYTEKEEGCRITAYMPVRFRGTRILYAHWKKR